MHVTIIQVPYHLGRPRDGVGRGPARLVLGGLADSLAGPGVSTSTESVEQIDLPAEEPELVARVNERLAERVRFAAVSAHHPVVLAGDCNSAIATLGGLAAAGRVAPAVLWFDAHGDVNTPATSPSGFLDGMALAIATGRSHDALRRRAGLEPPLPAERIVLIGARDLDAGEEDWLAESPVRVVRAEALQSIGLAVIAAPLARVVADTADVYLHVDLDALDPADAPATGYPTPGGLTPDTLAAVLRLAVQRFHVRALAVTNYDPERDEDDRTLGAAMRVVHSVVRAVERKAARA